MQRMEPPILATERQRVRRYPNGGFTCKLMRTHPLIRPVRRRPNGQVGTYPDREIGVPCVRTGFRQLSVQFELQIPLEVYLFGMMTLKGAHFFGRRNLIRRGPSPPIGGMSRLLHVRFQSTVRDKTLEFGTLAIAIALI